LNGESKSNSLKKRKEGIDMSRKWIVQIEGGEYVVEVRHRGLSPRREVLVDGKVVDTLFGLPKETIFQIGEKRATLRRRSTLNRNLELFIEGQRIEHSH
jgi:hypothetical protein